MSVFMIIEAMFHDAKQLQACADETIKLVMKFEVFIEFQGSRKNLEGGQGKHKSCFFGVAFYGAMERFWNSIEDSQIQELYQGKADIKVRVSETLSKFQ